MTVPKLRIAWFSALNLGACGPSTSGWVSDLLLPELSSRFEIELFCDSFKRYPGFATRNFVAACERHREAPFDLFFYQLEDRKESDFVRLHIGLMPGIVYFHDFLLTQDGPPALCSSRWQETVAAFNAEGPRLVEHLGVTTPEALREGALAGVALFSDERHHDLFRTHVTERIGKGSKQELIRSCYLPFPLRPQSLKATAGQEICFCGSPRIEHRAHKMLAAIQAVDRGLHLHWLIDRSERPQAQALIKEFGLESVELIEGRSPSRWQELVRHCDIALHPLFSVYGQTGPYLEISLGSGLTVISSDFGASDYLSGGQVYLVEPGLTEAQEFEAALRSVLTGNRAAPETIAAAVLEQHDVRVVADELSRIFIDSAPLLAELMQNFETQITAERQRLLAECARLADNPPSEVLESAFADLGWRG